MAVHRPAGASTIEQIPVHGFCVPLRGTRHPWRQPLTPSGSTVPNDRALFEQAPNIGDFLQSTRQPFSAGTLPTVTKAGNSKLNLRWQISLNPAFSKYECMVVQGA